MDGMATLQEVDEHWTLNDIADAHEALDIKGEAEAYHAHKNRPKK